MPPSSLSQSGFDLKDTSTSNQLQLRKARHRSRPQRREIRLLTILGRKIPQFTDDLDDHAGNLGSAFSHQQPANYHVGSHFLSLQVRGEDQEARPGIYPD